MMRLESYNRLKSRCVLFDTVLLKSKNFGSQNNSLFITCNSWDNTFDINVKNSSTYEIINSEHDILNSFVILNTKFVGKILVYNLDGNVKVSVPSINYTSSLQCINALIRTPVAAFRIDKLKFSSIIDFFEIDIKSSDEHFVSDNLTNLISKINETSNLVDITTNIDHNEKYIIDHYKVNRLNTLGTINMNAGSDVPLSRNELGKIHINMEDVGDTLVVRSTILSWENNRWC